MTCAPESAPCLSEPARFHVVEGAAGGSGVIFFPVDDCASVVARSGQLLFGCPGDAQDGSAVGAPGAAGVFGSLPSSIRFDAPTAVNYGGASTVRIVSADSDAGVAAGTAVGSVWSTGGGLVGVVAPGMAGLAAAALAVVLIVRWVRRTRRSI